MVRIQFSRGKKGLVVLFLFFAFLISRQIVSTATTSFPTASSLCRHIHIQYDYVRIQNTDETSDYKGIGQKDEISMTKTQRFK